MGRRPLTEREAAREAGKRDRYLIAVRRAARRRHNAEQAFRAAVVAASVDGGQSLREIAEAAGLSHVRVLTIVREGGNDGG